MTQATFALRRKVYLFLLNTLRVPRERATRLVKKTARLVGGTQARRRATVEPVSGSAISVPEEIGYYKLSRNELPGTAELVAECQAVFRAYRESGRLAERMNVVKKPFLVQVTDAPDALMTRKAVRDFVLSDAVLNTATRYMGAVPLLTEVQLLWSPVNESNVQSQQYHFDAEDFRQLKFFINIEEVTPECGPFTLVSSRISENVKQQTGYVGGRRARLSDELVAQNVGPGDEVSIVGPAGAGIVCDTSRCLHYGSRGNTRERLVLLIQFMDYFAPKMEPTSWVNAVTASSVSTRQALVLNLA